MIKKLTIILFFLLFVLVSLGCSGSGFEPTLVPTMTSQIIPTPMNDPNKVAELVEELLSELEEPTPVSEAEDSSDDSEPATEVDYCIECHINQQMLIDTAKPEEAVISENEGEG
jgi:hypothetical protein